MTRRSWRSTGLAIGLLLLVAVGYTWATWYFFTRPIPGGNDFLTHYGAWEAYLKDGVSPYSEEAALHTQRAIYGRAAMPGEDQNRMVYPFYSILVHGPFVYIDYAVARAIYMTLLQAALFGGMILSLDLVRWRPPAWLLAVLLVWSLLFYPAARGVILGQFAIFGFFSLAAALYLLKQGRDGWAGVVFVLATGKPTLIFLVAPFLLLWAVFRGRWRFVAGFVGTLAVLSAASLLLSPTWISDWIYRITRYSEYTVGQSPVWLLTHVALPVLGGWGEALIAGLLLAWMGWAWWRAFRREGQEEFYWALGVTLAVSNLIVSRSATTNYVLMLVPLTWVLAALARSFSWGRAALLATLLVSFVGLWWLHFATVTGNQEQPVLFIPFPLALALVLLAGRRWLASDAARNRVAL